MAVVEVSSQEPKMGKRRKPKNSNNYLDIAEILDIIKLIRSGK
jgi:hypothetical protein